MRNRQERPSVAARSRRARSPDRRRGQWGIRCWGRRRQGRKRWRGRHWACWHWASADHFVTTLYTSCVSLAVAIILRLVVPFSFYAQFLIVMFVTSFLLVS